MYWSQMDESSRFLTCCSCEVPNCRVEVYEQRITLLNRTEEISRLQNVGSLIRARGGARGKRLSVLTAPACNLNATSACCCLSLQHDYSMIAASSTHLVVVLHVDEVVGVHDDHVGVVREEGHANL